MSRVAQRAVFGASLVGLGTGAVLLGVIMTPMSGCCGGPPTGSCTFVETVDAGADGTLVCGRELCTPGVTECCFQKAGPTEMCVPIGTPCDGQVATCDGDEDCPVSNGVTLHCCGLMIGDLVRCLATCPGDSASGTIRLCHSDRDCPPNLPSCLFQTLNGRSVQACAPLGH